jgi:hypothetical protein
MFEGQTVVIGPGIVVRAGHPIMAGHEDLFVPLIVHYDVEPEVAARSTPPQGRSVKSTTRT